MHLNRFTSIWLPLFHYKLWKRSHFQYAVFVIFLFAFGVNYENLFMTGYYTPNAAGYAIFAADRATLSPISLWTEKSMSHVYPLTSLGINLGTVSKVLYMRYLGKSLGAKSLELNLLFICLASLFVQIGLMVWVDYGNMALDQATWLLVLNLASDCSTLSEAYIGLAVNNTLRRTFLSYFCLSIKIGSDVTFSNPSNPQN
ncbi:unnamed protein product, partial [Mesorhabditis belari]|uniref:Serpentine receptor class gamma n=1 Tax=Mesorhabditis belari TaxID=2138241 RepID=A0AAF3FBY5_9BILA